MHLSAPPALHPTSSLLGRAIRRRATDARQAESLYIVATALVLVTAALLGQWGWMLGKGSPVAYGIAVSLGWGIIGTLCLVGWRPRLHIRGDGGALHVSRGAESLVLPYERIESFERVPAVVYHRHWRRYAATRVFVNRLPSALLLLRTAEGSVVLGLAPGDLAQLEAHLAAHLEAETSALLVRAA